VDLGRQLRATRRVLQRRRDRRRFPDRHNGDYFLIADVTVFNDATKDSLNGSGGSDWLFADAADKIIGLTKSDDLTGFS
jgi:hypothetical protein